MIDLSRRLVGVLAVSAASLLLAACAMAPHRKAPPAIQAAERHNATGIVALEQGRFASAESAFIAAYRDYASVEDFPGMVTVLVNSSRLYRKQGKGARAAAAIDQAESLIVHVPELASEVWFEKGKISSMQDDVHGALRWADKALQAAGDNNRAMVLNFSAVLLLQAHDLQQAEARSGAALKESRNSGDRHEEADALSTLGDIALSRKEGAGAENFYRSALEIHKQLADSRAVQGDLQGLAASLQQEDRQRDAADYLIRAAEVALSRGDAAGASAAYAQAAALCAQAGDTAAAATVTEKLNRLRFETKGSKLQ